MLKVLLGRMYYIYKKEKKTAMPKTKIEMSDFTKFCNYQEERIAQSNLSERDKFLLRCKVLQDAIGAFKKR